MRGMRGRGLLEKVLGFIILHLCKNYEGLHNFRLFRFLQYPRLPGAYQGIRKWM